MELIGYLNGYKILYYRGYSWPAEKAEKACIINPKRLKR
jgi:hypothetical protein